MTNPIDLSVSNLRSENGSLIPICIAADARYLDGLICTAASLLVNLDPSREVKFYFFLKDNTPKSRKQVTSALQKIARSFEIVFVDRDYSDFAAFPKFFYESPMLYARLLTASYVKERRYLYLDSDLLILGDVSKLFDVELKEAAIGGCVDETVVALRNDCPKFNDYGFDPEAPSYNSGVLVIDKDKVIQEGLFIRAIEHLRGKPDECALHDQSALNFSCFGRWETIDQKWNKMINHLDASDLKCASRSPCIIHFVTNFKPWLYFSDRCAFAIYRLYLRQFGSTDTNLIISALMLKQRAKELFRSLGVSPNPETESEIRIEKLYSADMPTEIERQIVLDQKLVIENSMKR